MKKFMTIAIGAITAILVLAPGTAMADGGYTCDLDGHIGGASLGFGLSAQVLSGKGVLRCRDNSTGEYSRRNVKLSLVGAGVGFDFTVVRSLRLHAAGIETARGLDDFDHSFSVGAIAGATVLSDGLSAQSALRVSNEGLGFELGLMGQEAVGLGVRLQGMVFSIERI